MSFEFFIIAKHSCTPVRPFGQTTYIACHRTLLNVNV